MKLLPRLSTTYTLLALAMAGALAISPAGANSLAAATAVSPLAAAAIAGPGRPDADKARDADRKPAEMVDFAELKPGQVAIDFIPGKGYFTRIFSNAVGPSGTVYAVTPQLVVDKFKGKLPPPVSAEPGRGNVHEAISTNGSLNVPAKVDLVWTSQNYHDIHIWAGNEAVAQFNKAVYDTLKPGGIYVVLDHAGPAGLDDAGMSKMHRIDEELVKREVLAAGFLLDGESQVLRDAADPRNVAVFDPSIRGKTDQFILRFRKPN